jgi:hypothetical protein
MPRHVLSASVLAFPSFLARHTATFYAAQTDRRRRSLIACSRAYPKFECVQRLEGECIKFIPLASSRQNPS